MKKIMKKMMFLIMAAAMCFTQMHLPLNVNAAVKNLALEQGVEVSGLEVVGQFSGDLAVDGERYDRASRWSSGNINSPQWLSVDFKEPTTFNTIKIFWEASAGKKYKLQASNDNQNWTDIYSTENGPGNTDIIQLTENHTARYLRIYITEGNGVYSSVSIFEFEVYNYSIESILDETKSEITVPELAKKDFQVPIRGTLGAEIEWTSDAADIISIDNATGAAKVVNPETNTTVALTAQIAYQGQTISAEYFVHVLSEESINSTYQVYPTPQSMEMTYSKITLSDQINVVMGADIDELTKSRIFEVLQKYDLEAVFSSTAVADKTNLYVGINGSEDAADVYATDHEISKAVFDKTDNCFDNHLLSINEDNTILILGKDSDAAYYALATLDQVFKVMHDRKITTAIFEDYANTRYRGIIEGFYGFPYSVTDRLSLMDYMKENKMNTFIYGPKSDPYHLGNWKDDYPTTLTDKDRKNGQITQDDLRTIAKKAQDNNIDFVWSAHPAMQAGIDFTTEAGLSKGKEDLMTKFEHLYDLGVRQFGIFVDDIDLSNAYRDRVNHAKLIDLTQKAIDAEYNTESAEESDQVKPLFFVPSFYALDFGGASQREEYLRTLRTIDEKVVITFTGAGCWSNVENNSLLKMKNLIQRTPAMWWNYPVNDNIDDQLYMNPINSVYNVSTESKDFQGFMSNPMNQAEASKVSLFGVADFSWNTSNFNAKENWDQSFASYSDDPVIQSAIRTFSLHSGKTKDFSGIKAMYDAFKADVNAGKMPSNAADLSAKMEEIIQACDTIKVLESGTDQKLAKFAQEVRPWVNKLRAMAIIIDKSITVLTSDNAAVKWTAYTEANELYATLHTSIDHKVDSLEGQGTSVTPSQFEVMPGEVYTRPFTDYIFGKTQDQFSDIPQRGEMEVHSNVNAFSATLTDTKGTVKLTSNAEVTLQASEYIGVNLHTVKAMNALMGDLPEGLVIEGSINGKEWATVTEADLPFDAVYVRVKNISDEPISWDANKFNISYKVGTSVIKTEASMKIYKPYDYPLSNLTDGDPVSYIWTGEAQAPGQIITITLDKTTPLHDLSLVFTGSDCLSDEAVLEISNDKATWETIGTLTRAELEANNYIYEKDATGKSAQYLRLRITKVSTNSWMKFNEFSINTKADQMIANPIAYIEDNDVISAAMEIADRNVFTKYAVQPNTSLTYQFIDNKKNTKINLLTRYKGAVEDAPLVEILDDQGWKQIGRLDGTVSLFDVEQYRNLKAVRVTCQNEPIEIYEIYEEGDVYQEANRKALLNAIANVPSKEESAYTSESYAAYITALEKAKELAGSTELAQVEADLAAADLTVAFAALELKVDDSDTALTKAILKSTIDKANAAESSGQLDVLAPAVKRNILIKRDAAQIVYNNDNASNKEILQAWFELADALHYLDFKADKAALKDAIDLYNDIDLDIYTDESADIFRTSYKNAEDVYMDENALQARIDEAYTALDNAVKGLVKKDAADKTVLQMMVDAISEKTADDSKYKKDSYWETFKEALQNAKDVLANDAISQNDINGAANSLASAYEDLRLLPDESQLAQLQYFSARLKQMNRSLYSDSQLTMIDQAYEDVQAMLNDFDSKRYASLEAMVNEVFMMQPEKEDTTTVPQEPAAPADTTEKDAVSKPETRTKPATSDNTNMAGILLLLAVSGLSVHTIQRKRKS